MNCKNYEREYLKLTIAQIGTLKNSLFFITLVVQESGGGEGALLRECGWGLRYFLAQKRELIRDELF